MAQRTKARQRKAPKKATAGKVYLPPPIQRELPGVLLVFALLFVLASLLSYHHADPSPFQPNPQGEVRNLFGVMGAGLAGFLIGIFGFGAFWFPPLMLVFSIHFFRNTPMEELSPPTLGSAMLVLGTSGFFAMWADHVTLLGTRFAAGGAAGEGLKNLVVHYFGYIGGSVVFLLMIAVAVMLTTGLSFLYVGERLFDWAITHGPKAGEKVRKAWRQGRERVNVAKVLTSALQTLPRLPLQESFETVKRLLPLPAGANGSSQAPSSDNADIIEGTVIPDTEAEIPGDSGGASSIPPPGEHVTGVSDPAMKAQMPDPAFLSESESTSSNAQSEYLDRQAQRLTAKLADFGVKGEVAAKLPGPVITTFEFKPAPGVKINKIVNLTDDLAMALRALSVRIIAPIPGKPVVGIEIPNPNREVVRLRDIVASEAFQRSESLLTICMGKDIVGRPVVSQLDKMPHLLIAGATGTGKSVFLNALICSLLYKSGPDDVKFIMIDPKRIELSMYDDIPHLIAPVVTDVKKATHALYWAVGEMERRYELLSGARVRNIRQYNRKIAESEEGGEPMPFIVLIIDELADLMMIASRDVEVSLTRLAQMARAAGIHLILATQRPSVDVLTGIIKANFPTRLTFQVSSKIDSRTIIDGNGAETLLGNGDMLFLPPGTGRLQRIHGPYISEAEVTRITDFLKDQKSPDYDESVVASPLLNLKRADDEKGYDEKYDDAVALVTRTRQASVTLLQKQLKVGRARAAKILQTLEDEGVVGPSDGTEPREVLVRGYDNP